MGFEWASVLNEWICVDLISEFLDLRIRALLLSWDFENLVEWLCPGCDLAFICLFPIQIDSTGILWVFRYLGSFLLLGLIMTLRVSWFIWHSSLGWGTVLVVWINRFLRSLWQIAWRAVVLGLYFNHIRNRVFRNLTEFRILWYSRCFNFILQFIKLCIFNFRIKFWTCLKCLWTLTTLGCDPWLLPTLFRFDFIWETIISILQLEELFDFNTFICDERE